GEGDACFSGLGEGWPEFRDRPFQTNFVGLQNVKETSAAQPFCCGPGENERVIGPRDFALRVAIAAVQIQHRLAVLPDRDRRSQFTELGKIFREDWFETRRQMIAAERHQESCSCLTSRSVAA